MCGRFTLFSNPQQLARQFNVSCLPDRQTDRYNIAPGQEVLALYPAQKELLWSRMGWGFPSRPGSTQKFVVNARAETVAEKSTFRDAFRKRRCLIPACGFYEWLRSAGEPWYFQAASGEILGLAGIWKSLPGPESNHRSLVVLTREAVAPVTAVHHRMPLLLNENDGRDWLNPATSEECLQAIIRNTGPLLIHHPVSREVNRTKTDHPGLIDALSGVNGELFE